MAKYSRKCVLCGKEYEYCNTCFTFFSKPIWMFNYCSEDCKDIVPILTDYVLNKINKEEAKEQLEGKDMSRHMFYSGSYKKAYDSIMNDEEDNSEKQDDIKTDDTVKLMSNQTVATMKSNFQSEAKKTYPKAVAHKHGR